MSPGAYLRGMAASRALYLWLFEDAVGMLPPPLEGVAHELASHATFTAIATRLGISRSTMQRDLVRLSEWGWVRVEEKRICLGRRESGVSYLLADLAAEPHTGQPDTVSRLVLHLKPPVGLKTKKMVTPNRRGTARAWEGMDDTWGNDGKKTD